MSREILEGIIKNFSQDEFIKFFRDKNRNFSPLNEDFAYYNDDNFNNGLKLGEIRFSPSENLIVCAFQAGQPLSERSGKKAQYEKGKKILKDTQADAGIFIFHDEPGNFRFSLIYANYLGKRRDWNNFRRFTYFVGKKQTNKTFLRQIGETDFLTLEKIKEAFSVDPVTKQFYNEIQGWYFWTMDKISFPDDYKYNAGQPKDKEVRNATNLIRLITRIIFIWFLIEKELVPIDLFSKEKLKGIVLDFMENEKAYNFYNAILQNLFFGTLNQKMNERKFTKESSFLENKEEYGVKNIYRYADKFLISKDEVLKLFKDVPFLNGGLFDCLDKEDDTGKVIYIDGFSRNPSKQALIPDYLFFQQKDEVVNLSQYGLGKHSVRGLIEILNSYNFTIDENTPIDQEIALDPELLGKVFENLLASYNPETATTARRATGSYYTPREIVDYMVETSLFEYLNGKFPEIDKEKIKILLSYSDEVPEFSREEKHKLISAIDDIKILDPACGSGAFPMGILHKLVFSLQKLDPENKYWYELQYQKALKESQKVFKQNDKGQREERLKEINETFDEGINYPDYARKLYLIENCIYGVDIQPIAIQVSKLRFFISLVLDQKVDARKENLGIRALPNLETKFVSANTLMGLDKPAPLFYPEKIEKLEDDIKYLRHRYFQAKTRREKLDYQNKDRRLRMLLLKELESIGYSSDSSEKIAKFDPYDQNASADFFDPEWMFGITSGFDIVIGNPPYIFARNSVQKGLSEEDKRYFYHNYELAKYQVNLYPLFIEKATQILSKDGLLTFITPNNWLTINTNRSLREFVLEKSNIIIVNFYAQVFESAAVDSAVVIFTNNKSHQFVSLYEYTDGLHFIKKVETYYFLKQRDFVVNIEAFKSDGVPALLSNIEQCSVTLDELADVKAGLVAYEEGKGNPPQTKVMKDKRVYHSTKKLGLEYYKYLDGKDVCRYYCGWSGEYLKYGDNLAAPRKDFALFSGKRIIVRQIPGKPPYCIHACMISDTYLNDRNSMNVINLKESPELLLGIINSRVISFWFIHKFGKLQRGTFPQFKINELAVFPIPKDRTAYKDGIVRLVKEIMDIKLLNHDADTLELDSQIDSMVYELYGITPEEIKIIEEDLK